MDHLDSLVFSDESLKWCETDLDCIGAGWLKCPVLPWVTEPRVGNGGFALMKVEAVLKGLYKPLPDGAERVLEGLACAAFRPVCAAAGSASSPASGVVGGRMRKLWEKVENTHSNRLHNDIFRGYCATRYFPGVRLPDWKTGLRFAFELNGGSFRLDAMLVRSTTGVLGSCNLTRS